MKESIISKTKQKTVAQENEQLGLDTVSKVSLAFMGTVSAAIGIWAVICLVSVMAQVGPIDFIKGWFQAVTGM